MFVEPDTCHLHISDAINRDVGLYSITASNVAGSVSHSIMVHVEEDERRYWDQTYLRPKPVRPHKEMPLAETYDLGDELGRGTQGITYHAVERSTGERSGRAPRPAGRATKARQEFPFISLCSQAATTPPR